MQFLASRQFNWSLFLTLASCCLLPWACGDDESGEETVQAKFSKACDETAVAMADAESCPDTMDIAGLTTFCKIAGMSMLDNADCRQKADAHLRCVAQYEYRCAEGGEIPLPTNSELCDEESAPFLLSNENPGDCVDPAALSAP